MISALLLAAGEGRRMQCQPKALLRRDGRTFIESALEQLRGTVDDVIVVTGAYREAVRSFVQEPAREIHNPDFAAGLLTSIQSGLRACSADTTAVLITLVDLPFLNTALYQEALARWRPGCLLRTMSGGKPGHPVIIPRIDFAEILQQPAADRGCAFLFQKYPERVLTLESASGHIDIDSLEDYHAHVSP